MAKNVPPPKDNAAKVTEILSELASTKAEIAALKQVIVEKFAALDVNVVQLMANTTKKPKAAPGTAAAGAAAVAVKFNVTNFKGAWPGMTDAQQDEFHAVKGETAVNRKQCYLAELAAQSSSKGDDKKKKQNAAAKYFNIYFSVPASTDSTEAKKLRKEIIDEATTIFNRIVNSAVPGVKVEGNVAAPEAAPADDFN